MKEVFGDLWSIPADARCITTNGSVRHKRAVMGGGCAYEATQRYSNLEYRYGFVIRKYGHRLHVLEPDLVAYPVKQRVEHKATLPLILQSAFELVELIEWMEWESVLLPRPGCGLGGLRWEDVAPVLGDVLDDRITVVGYPEEGQREASTLG